MTTDKSSADALTDLLPCPHCGHAAQIVTGDGPFFGRVQVECRSCRIATFWYDEAVAVRQWNRRVAASPSSQPAAAPIPYDGLTEEFTDEVARLADDAPGIREAVSAALENCNAIIAPQGNAAPAPADERAAFEAWMQTGVLDSTPDLARDDLDNYDDWNTQRAWRGWQARASSANETGAPIGWAWISPTGHVSRFTADFDGKHDQLVQGWKVRPVAFCDSIANETGAEGAEPCAWLVEWTPNVSDKVWVQSFVNELDAINKQRQVGGRIIACAPINALSHAPAHAAEPVAIPVGWKLVPVAPTPEMCCAMEEAIDAGWKDSVVWARGIAAAPQPPAQADARDGLTDEQLDAALAEFELAMETDPRNTDYARNSPTWPRVARAIRKDALYAAILAASPVQQPAAALNRDAELGAFVRRSIAALADSPKSFLANVQRAIEDQAEVETSAHAPAPADEREAFEKVFPMPAHCQRIGHGRTAGYAPTEYGAWEASDFIRRWEGWKAARAASANETADERAADTLLAIGRLLRDGGYAPDGRILDAVRDVIAKARASSAKGAEGAPVAWMRIDDPRDCISDAKKRDMIEHAGAPGARLAENYSIALGKIGPAQAVEPVAIYQILTEEGAWLDTTPEYYDRVKSDPALARVVYAAPQPPAQADARDGLTIDRIESLARTHLYVGDDDVVFGTENFARAIERDILATHPGQPEPIAWESTTVAYTKYITDERYQKFSPEVRKWYKPYRCSACSEPCAEVTDDDKVCAERYRWLRARMAFVEGPNAAASMSMRSSIPAPNHDFNADFVGDRFDASVDAAIDGAIAAARAHGQDSGSLAESKSAVKAPRCY